MPVLKCLNAGCQWQSQDLDAAFADALTKQLEVHNQEVHVECCDCVKLVFIDLTRYCDVNNILCRQG